MQPKPISLDEASTKLSEFVGQAVRGEEVILGDGDRPLARLVLFHAAETPRKRIFGQFCGKIHISEDFDDPLPDEIWENGLP